MDYVRSSFFPVITCLLIIAALLALPVDCPALASFASLGIDGKTMTVQNPAILQGAGLRDIRAGDAVRVIKNPTRSGFTITNSRTGRSIQYPPVPAAGGTSRAASPR